METQQSNVNFKFFTCISFMSGPYGTGMNTFKQHMAMNTQYIVTSIIISDPTSCYKRYL